MSLVLKHIRSVNINTAAMVSRAVLTRDTNSYRFIRWFCHNNSSAENKNKQINIQFSKLRNWKRPRYPSDRLKAELRSASSTRDVCGKSRPPRTHFLFCFLFFNWQNKVYNSIHKCTKKPNYTEHSKSVYSCKIVTEKDGQYIRGIINI